MIRGGSSRARLRQMKQGSNLVRSGQLELVVPLVVLSLLSIGVVVYNFMKWHVVEPCSDTSHLFAKHFYCYNASASPGVHVDKN